MNPKEIISDLNKQIKRKQDYAGISEKDNVVAALGIEIQILKRSIFLINEQQRLIDQLKHKNKELVKFKEYLEGIALYHGITDLEFYYYRIDANVLESINRETEFLKSEM